MKFILIVLLIRSFIEMITKIFERKEDIAVYDEGFYRERIIHPSEYRTRELNTREV